MNTKVISKEELKQLYDKDYPAWVDMNLQLLKEKAYELVDWDNLLEEIEDMGRSDLKACISYLAVILEHLYKLDNFRMYTQAGFEKGGRGWVKSIITARGRLEVLIKHYPSLKPKIKEELETAWEMAIPEIVASAYEMGVKISKDDIPKHSPYTYEEAMERDVMEEF
ncbi:MAG: DUF29 domain-containing protein [Hydrogenothermaceae bacterium]